MNPFIDLRLTIQMVALLMISCGCGPNSLTTDTPESPEVLGAAFKEGKGLEISEQTKKALGLEMVEVTEEKMSSTFVIPIQVYREATTKVISSNAKSDRAYATGVINVDQAKQVKPGQSVTLEITESSSEQVLGKVIRLNRSTESVLGGIEVLLEIPDSQHLLEVGAMLQATFTSSKEESVTVIPKSALLKTATGTFVYVLNGKHLFRTAVKIGSENEDFVEIKDGLYSGDQVAKQPVMSLWMAELQAVNAGTACGGGH
jgi:multidrug efflux pump subunit AcrA (membrane-fusion protein)